MIRLERLIVPCSNQVYNFEFAVAVGGIGIPRRILYSEFSVSADPAPSGLVPSFSEYFPRFLLCPACRE